MDLYSYTDTPKYQPQDIEDASEFYNLIERSSLTDRWGQDALLHGVCPTPCDSERP